MANAQPGTRLNEHIEDDGPTVFARTISEACDYMTDMGRKRELRQHWQRLASSSSRTPMCLPLAGLLSLRYLWMPNWTCRKFPPK